MSVEPSGSLDTFMKAMRFKKSEHQERIGRIRRAADYPLTIVLINPLNRRLVRPLARLGISPNAVTGASLVLSVLAAGALYLAASRYLWACILAPLLVFLSHLCDALDGDLARYTGHKSRLGAALDPIFDRVGEVVYVVGVAAGYSHLDPGSNVWIAASLCIGGILTYNYTTEAQVNRILDALPNDPRRYAVTFGKNLATRIKLGMYEPFMYGLALATAVGLGDWALWFFTAAFWAAWAGMLVKLKRVCARAEVRVHEDFQSTSTRSPESCDANDS